MSGPDRLRAVHCWTLAALIAVSGCSVDVSVPKPAQEIRVAAASDLQGVLPEIVRRFEETSALKVRVTYASSGKLTEQIRAGAKFDLFLAANESFVKKLADEKLVLRESIQPYAIGSLVLVVRRESAEAVRSLNDLTNPAVKHVSIANPVLAPYGAAAREALDNSGVWDEVEPKLIFADSVRQAYLFVESGNADAALVGRAVVNEKQVGVVEVDPATYDPIVQYLGFVKTGEPDHDPAPFARYLRGPDGRSILEAHGFKVPAAAGP